MTTGTVKSKTLNSIRRIYICGTTLKFIYVLFGKALLVIMNDKRKAAVNEVHFVAFRLISLSLRYRLLFNNKTS